jgi:hypothetical protein
LIKREREIELVESRECGKAAAPVSTETGLRPGAAEVLVKS